MNGPIQIFSRLHSGIWGLILLAGFLASLSQVPIASSQDPSVPVSNLGQQSGSYILGPEDQLEMTIAEDPLPQGGASRLYVNALGEIFAPVSAGFEKKIRIHAGGLTLDALKQAVQKELEKDYYFKATVELRLLQARPDMKTAPEPGEVLFYGEVRGQVKLDPTKPMMLSKAILLLGYSEFANLKKVRLYRRNSETAEQEIQVIDLHAVLFRNEPEKDVRLQDRDRVETPERGFVL